MLLFKEKLVSYILQKKFFLSILSETRNNLSANLFYKYYESINPNTNLTCIVSHGLFGCNLNFKNLASNISIQSKANSYLLDLRNHGNSDHLPEFNFPLLALDLYNFIEMKNLSNLILIGHSMGAKSTMTLLTNYPEIHHKIKGVIIIDAAPIDYFNNKNFEWPKDIVNILTKLAIINLKNTNFQKIKTEIFNIGIDQGFFNLILSNLTVDEFNHSNLKWRTNIKSISTNYAEMLSFVPKGSLYNGKYRIILGDRSGFVPIEYWESFANIFKNLDLINNIKIVKDAGHWVHADQPEIFADLVSKFLEEFQN